MTAHSVIGADHYLPSILSRRGQLAPLLIALARGRPLPLPPETGAVLAHPAHVAALARSSLALAARDWPLALTQAEAALAACPGEGALIAQGRALIQLGRPAEAVAPFARALAFRPEDAGRMAHLAQALRRSGDVIAARALFARAVAADPGHDEALYGLALAHQGTGDLPAALAAITRALRIAPRNPSYLRRAEEIRARIRPADPRPSASPP